MNILNGWISANSIPVNATLRGPANSVRRAEAAPGVTSAAEIAVEINVRYKPTLD